MTAHRRKFTDDQKLSILQQAGRIGVIAAIREHNLSYSVFARWKNKFMKNEPASAGLSANKTRSELKHLNEENVRLKKIIAEQALQLERKDEELRKINALYAKK